MILIRLTVKTQADLNMRQQRNSLNQPDWVRTKELRSQSNTPLSLSKNPMRSPPSFQNLVFLLGLHRKKSSQSVLQWRLPILVAKTLISWDQLWTWGQSISSTTKWRLEISNLIATSQLFLSIGSFVKTQSPKYLPLWLDSRPHWHEEKARRGRWAGRQGYHLI